MSFCLCPTAHAYLAGDPQVVVQHVRQLYGADPVAAAHEGGRLVAQPGQDALDGSGGSRGRESVRNTHDSNRVRVATQPLLVTTIAMCFPSVTLLLSCNKACALEAGPNG